MAKGNGYYRTRWDDLSDYPGERSRIYSGPLACENFAMIVVPHPPGQEGTLHSHDLAEEVYVLLKGEGVLRVGDEEITMHHLDAVRVEPGVEHATSNRSGDDVWWLVIGSPTDEFLAFDPIAYGPPAEAQ